MTQALLRTRKYEPSAPPRIVLERTGSATCGELLPSWRGVSHEKAFAMAPAMALLLVASAEGARAQSPLWSSPRPWRECSASAP